MLRRRHLPIYLDNAPDFGQKKSKAYALPFSITDLDASVYSP
jgi:hypothetical protein